MLPLDVAWGASAARLGLLAGCTVAIGALAHEAFLAGDDRALSPLLFLVAVGLVALASVAEVALLLLDLAGGDMHDAVSMLGPMFATVHGSGGVMLYRLAVLLLVGGWRFAARRRAGAATLMVLGGLLASTLTVDGHGADDGIVSVRAAIDWVHGFSAMIWLGGLLLLWRAIPRLAAPMVQVETFSRVATIAFPLALAAGVANAWLQLAGHGGLAALGDTPYGTALVVKTLVVGVVLLLAAFLRQFRLPAIRQGHSAAVGLRGLLAVELVGGVLILAATAWLSELPSPGAM